METLKAPSTSVIHSSWGKSARSIILACALAALIACLCAMTGQKAYAAQAEGLAAGSAELAAQDDGNKPGIYAQTLWAGLEMVEYLNTMNMPSDAKFVSVKSSNTKVLKLKVENKSVYDVRLLPKKAGKSKVTLKYKTGGKTKTLTATFKVNAFPKPFKSIKVNGANIKVPGAQYKKSNAGAYQLKGTKLKVDVAMAKGWTLSYMGFGTYTPGKGDYKDKEIKSGKSYSFPKAARGDVWISVYKDGNTSFSYYISLSHQGPLSLESSDAYVGFNTSAYVSSAEPAKDIKVTKVASSNTKVMKAKMTGKEYYKIMISGVKAGKATLTVTYKFGGKTYKASGTYVVTKHPRPFKSLAVNGKNIKLANYPFSYGVYPYKKASAKVKVTPSTGWKIVSMKLEAGSSSKAKTIKNGASFKTPKGTSTMLNITMKDKKGNTYGYPVYFDRF